MKTATGTTLRFLGASGTVTGSRFLLETSAARVLLDCGLFQGGRALRRRNWDPPPFEPQSLDAVLLSHGHLDHSGHLPVLVRRGFRGPVHGTAGTRDLLGVLLPDAAQLEKEQARHLSKHGLSRHHPALPLFTEEDARAALERFQVHAYGAEWPVAPTVQATLARAGHILGSAAVEVRFEDGLCMVHSGPRTLGPADPAGPRIGGAGRPSARRLAELFRENLLQFEIEVNSAIASASPPAAVGGAS